MAQADTGKEEVLACVHVKTVREVLRRLLENAVAKENGDWTMDDFLYHHRPQISSTLIGNENERLLFPGFNKTTNVDNWPLCLFHFLIVNITESEFIPEEIKELVRQLQQKRRELYAHVIEGINETYFAEHAEYIRNAVRRICEFMQNSDFKYKTDQAFTKALEHMEIQGGTDYIQEFNINHETEKSFRKKVTVFTPEQHRLHDFLEQNVANLEVCEHAPSARIVSIRQDDHLRDLEEAVIQGHDLTQSHLPPRPDTSKYSVTLPEEVIIEIQVSGCATGPRRSISERIVSSINTTHETDSTDREIQNVYKNTFLCYGEYLARRGCIQIVVRPRSVACLIQLFKDCVNGSLTERLRPTQDLIRKLPGCEQYEQEAVLYKDNYDPIMDKLAVQLMKQLVVGEQAFEPKHTIEAETSDEGNVLLHIKDCSSEECAAFKYAVKSGHLQPTLNVLQTKVRDIGPNVSLNSRIYHTDPKCAGALQTEESISKARERSIEPRSIDASIGLSSKRKPGRPSALYVGVDSVTLTWSVPDAFEKSGFFKVSFKTNCSDSNWQFDSQKVTDNKAMLKGFVSDCEYIFRVYCMYGETEVSYSEASEAVKTLPSPASKLVDFSVQSTQAGVSPSKFSLPTTEIKNARNEKAKTRKFEIGPTRPIDWSEKTILVVGETGTGKSTLVDGMVNYVLGVKWSDPYRFTIVNLEDEEISTKFNQALSQTEWITCYKVNHMEERRFKYTVNIIDTPGFGDTRGLDRNNAIVKRIRSLFTETEPKGILTIDAVCLLIKAPVERLTTMQRYIFQSIMSLFGKDIENNICSMVTFADGIDPPVFAALDKSGLPFGKHFTFNNSGLYAKNTNIDQYSLSPMFWNMGMASFENFFNHLDNMERKSLRLTCDVLNERNRLEATIQNLEPKLDAGLFHVDRLTQMIKTFEDNQSIMKANKDLTFVTKKTQQMKRELPKGQHASNCTHCTFTCHGNCSYPDGPQKRNCCAMDANGYCTMCPDKCFWDKHANTPYIYTYEIVEKTHTYSEMKDEYEPASGQLLTQEQLLDTMRQELEDMAETIEDMMGVVMECNQRLAEIALRPNPLTMTDQIDLMIENEKNTKKEGWMERIQCLHKLEKRANILEHVEDFLKKAKSVRPAKSKDAINAPKSKNVFTRIRDVLELS